MRIYKIETDYSRYTILANDFDNAIRGAKKILSKERALYGKDESPAIQSIIEGDEIDETKD